MQIACDDADSASVADDVSYLDEVDGQVWRR